MGKCQFNKDRWECPLTAENGDDFCYWHQEIKGKEPTQEQLEELKSTEIRFAFLQEAHLAMANLQEAQLTDIDFEGSELINCNFRSSTLNSCNFKSAKLIDCRFDKKEDDEEKKIKYEKTKLVDCSFESIKLSNCRFRNAEISKSNFKYAQINTATFEDALIKCCDLYRASFSGVVVFRDCKIENCSLHYTLFADGAIIRRDNLENGTLLQQNLEEYEIFLKKAWKNADYQQWKVELSISERFKDAEDIYRALSALWLSKGYMSDSNWAYVQARKIEYDKLKHELEEMLKEEHKSISKIIRQRVAIIGNIIVGSFFGYGESLKKLIIPFFATLIIFMMVYLLLIPDETLKEAFYLSLSSMFPSSSESIQGSFLVNLFITVQTTISVILIGIFGFILANKIRCQ